MVRDERKFIKCLIMDINKPVGALTVQELLDILQPIISNQNPIQPERTENVKHLVYGLKGLAELLHCSIATANRIKQEGCIDKAISQVGRKIVIDADLALELMKSSRKAYLRAKG